MQRPGQDKQLPALAISSIHWQSKFRINELSRRSVQRSYDGILPPAGRPALPLDNKGWIYTEPNPYNGNSPMPNLRVGEVPTLSVDLTSDELPPPRLKPRNGVVWVPAFTDLKLHDIIAGANDPNREPLDMNQKAGSENFFAAMANLYAQALGHRQPTFFLASRTLHDDARGRACAFRRSASGAGCVSGIESARAGLCN